MALDVGLGVAPGVLLFIGMLYLPDSPRWLLRRLTEAARVILQKVRGPKASIDEELEEIKEVLEKEGHTHWKAVFAKVVRPVLWIGFALAFIQQITGINTVLYYAPNYF